MPGISRSSNTMEETNRSVVKSPISKEAFVSIARLDQSQLGIMSGPETSSREAILVSTETNQTGGPEAENDGRQSVSTPPPVDQSVQDLINTLSGSENEASVIITTGPMADVPSPIMVDDSFVDREPDQDVTNVTARPESAILATTIKPMALESFNTPDDGEVDQGEGGIFTETKESPA